VSGGRTVRINLAARAATAQRRRALTRERLLDAAEAVVVEKGVESASIEEFVRAAGVSRGTFYNYFPTVTDLLHALNSRVAASMDRRLDENGAGIEDPATRLAASLHMVLAAYASDPLRGWLAVQLAASRAPRQQAFEARFADTYREAVAAGRFHPIDMNAAWTLAFGAIRMALRDIVAGASVPAQAVPIVALILVAFGLPLDEAEQISRSEAVAARAI